MVLGNGANRVAAGLPPAGLPSEPFALLVGAVSERKRQAETLRALGRSVPAVVAGRYAGSAKRQADWEHAVADTGAVWLGNVEPAALAAVRAAALALVHLSAAETQSLAVMEALVDGLPCVLSDIPSHRELSAAYPGWVRVVNTSDEVAGALGELRRAPPARPPPAIPTSTDVARRLVELYRTFGH